MMKENKPTNREGVVTMLDKSADVGSKMENKLIDLNTRPHRMHGGQASANQVGSLSNEKSCHLYCVIMLESRSFGN